MKQNKVILGISALVLAMALLVPSLGLAQGALSAFIVEPSNTTLAVNQEVDFSGSASGGSAPYFYAWTFGDGDTASGQSNPKSFSQAGTYTVTLRVRDFVGLEATATKVITVTGGAVAPTVELKANNGDSASVKVGQEVTLSWATSNATACTASGEWSGSKALGSSENVGPFTTTGSRTYTLTCTGPGGSTSDSVTVNVTPAQTGDVTVELKINGESASNITVATSSQYTISWTSANATACTASGEWSGAKATSGSEVMTAPSTPATAKTFTLTCTGASGSGTDTVIVTTATDGVSNPLVITNVRIESITQTSAVIRWTTNKPATSRVVYDTTSHATLGAAPNYGYANTTSTTDQSPMVVEHSVTITGLSANTTYYFRVISEA